MRPVTGGRYQNRSSKVFRLRRAVAPTARPLHVPTARAYDAVCFKCVTIRLADRLDPTKPDRPSPDALSPLEWYLARPGPKYLGNFAFLWRSRMPAILRPPESRVDPPTTRLSLSELEKNETQVLVYSQTS
ncbi:hypothetical protein EVAR_11310_1 [Eumeta japonica]|uniref:Uncharacterized protein n=1 Tax=Eumeta variegata TaxID=151549 RepID=A0A4C1U0Z2_EUMVA|nr:hypothetical protein EVAR_11310_1 [Eumeta japonica]